MTHRAPGPSLGAPKIWLLPVLAVGALAMLAWTDYLSRSLALDFVAWWPVWLLAILAAVAVRGRRMGRIRLSGVVPLLATAALGVFVATWAGNLAGAMLIYAVGRRYGAERLERRMLGDRAAEAESRQRTLYGKYGLTALFLSRFLPGVRAIVPPLAGALRVPAVRAAVAMGAASAVWYGAISYLAFRIGADWDQLSGAVSRYGRVAAITGGVLALLAVATWFLVRRRTEARR